jgi:hypothetical protein
MKNRSAFGCLCALLVLYTNAGMAAFTPCNDGATVIYVNGVDKPDKQVVAFSAMQLANTIGTYGVKCVADVTYHYNPSANLAVDVLIEFASQKRGEEAAVVASEILDFGMTLYGYLVSTISAEQRESIRAELSIRLQRALSTPGANEVTEELVTKVLDKIDHGSKVVLVSHSQGNLFANAAYNHVRAVRSSAYTRAFAVVNVANPSLVAPSGRSITSTHDYVIKPLSLNSSALAPTADGTGSEFFDWTGHGFGEVYLNRLVPTDAQAADALPGKLMALLQGALDQLLKPGPVTRAEAHYAGGYGTLAQLQDVLTRGWAVTDYVDNEQNLLIHTTAENCGNPDQEAKVQLLLVNNSPQPRNIWGDTPLRIAQARCDPSDPVIRLYSGL